MNKEAAGAELGSSGFDIVVASSPENVFYASGFPVNVTARNRAVYLLRYLGPQFVVLSKTGEQVLLVRQSALTTARRMCSTKEIRTYQIKKNPASELETRSAEESAVEGLADLIREMAPGNPKVGLEDTFPSSQYSLLSKRLNGASIGFASNLLSKIRRVKTPEEVERLRRATRITCDAITESMGVLRPGSSESEAMRRYAEVVVREGGDVSNGKIAGGKFGHVIGHQPSADPLKAGDLVLYDVGCFYDGYTADLGRVASIGAPNDRAAKMYEVLSKAQMLALESIRPGVRLSDVFRKAVAVVQAKFPNYKRDFIGHSIGVELEEEPFINGETSSVFEPGMVMAVELPYYEEGLGGFNVEDNIVVTRDGIEVMSRTLDRSIRVL